MEILNKARQLFETPASQRGISWEKKLLSFVDQVPFVLIHDHPIVGPDNMPYLALRLPASDETGETAKDIFRWAGDRGIGVVIEPDKNPPDLVFSFGMIWSYLLRGQFFTPEDSQPGKKEFALEEGQEIYVGPLSEQVWPFGPRSLFASFLKDQGLTDGRALFLSTDKLSYDLCFSLESLGNPPQEEWNGILETFSWFFPMDLSLSILSESTLKNVEFQSISSVSEKTS